MAESGDPGSLDLRASAIAAVDAAENSIKTKTPRTETAVIPGIPGVNVTGSLPSVATSTGSISVDTELSAELSSFPEGITGIKLVTLQASSAAADVTSVISPTASGAVCQSSLHHCTVLDTSEFKTFFCSIINLLERNFTSYILFSQLHSIFYYVFRNHVLFRTDNTPNTDSI